MEVKVLRKNGSDGKVTVDYETIALDDSDHTATPGIDYIHAAGTLIFEHGETQQVINVTILKREKEDEGEKERDETFAI